MNTIDIILRSIQFLTQQLNKAVLRMQNDADVLRTDADALYDAAEELEGRAKHGAKLAVKLAKLAD